MIRPTRKLLARIGVIGIIGAAFASAAIAADTTGALESNVGAVSAAATSVVSGVSLPAAASDVAVLVLDALAGGSNPSIAASQRSDPESRDQAKTGNGQAANAISAAEHLAPAGTVGMRPGWGCGDQNHTHTGPPGRPANAEPPPGCTKK
jgi:hypothetical protein